MVKRSADTFLVRRRFCFAILFSGQTPRWSLPRFLDIAASLHRPMRAYSSSRFLTRMRFGLRFVGARAVQTLEGIRAATSANKNARGSDPGHLAKPENWAAPAFEHLCGMRRFLLTLYPQPPRRSGIF